MTITPLALKIAVELIEDQLRSQQLEPADQPQTSERGVDVGAPAGTSALRFFGRERATATEPAPKVLSSPGSKDL